MNIATTALTIAVSALLGVLAIAATPNLVEWILG